MNCAIRGLLSSLSELCLIASLGCLLTGCSSGSQQISNEEAVTFPSSFEEKGATWTRAEAPSKADIRVLTEYFRRNASVAEGPLISGDPTLYSSSRGARRFYWGRSGAEEPEWIYIQFQGRKATVEEGRGSPLVGQST